MIELYLTIYVAVCVVGVMLGIGFHLRNVYRETDCLQLDIGDVIILLGCVAGSPIVVPLWIAVQLEKLFTSGFPPPVLRFLNRVVIRIGKKRDLAE